ncbi:MAG: hypothetical protein K2P93_07570 [Alphaproteobacteria bacterium]|nr:hypothetical protein [Alphaproteobacteria bacterium]
MLSLLGGFSIDDNWVDFDQVHVTPTHVSEVKELEEVIKNRRDKRLYGNKGYASQKNNDLLR